MYSVDGLKRDIEIAADMLDDIDDYYLKTESWDQEKKVMEVEIATNRLSIAVRELVESQKNL